MWRPAGDNQDCRGGTGAYRSGGAEGMRVDEILGGMRRRIRIRSEEGMNMR